MLEFMNLPLEEDGFFVRHEAMVFFLNQYGPLTPSLLSNTADTDSVSLKPTYHSGSLDHDWMRELILAGDGRNDERYSYRFFIRVHELQSIAELAEQRQELRVYLPLVAFDNSPANSLYRARVIQLLLSLLQPPFPRRCIGCGGWFRETETESQAIHGRGWKRYEAQYHNERCRKAAGERRRRARKRN